MLPHLQLLRFVPFIILLPQIWGENVKPDGQCYQGFKYYDDRCYYAVLDGQHTHGEARRSCESNRSTLVTIDNKNVWDFLLRTFNIKDPFWIGLANDGKDWKWPDGTTVKYQRWGKSQPDPKYACVVANRGGRGYWQTAECGKWTLSGAVGYICQTSGCPRGWKYFEQRCYHAVLDGIYTHNAAHMNCASKGGRLVTLDNKRLSLFLFHAFNIKDHPFWIGAMNIKNDWKWENGSTVKFEQWGKSQPDPKYHCAVANRDGKGRWHTASCGKWTMSGPIGYICEKSFHP